MKNKNLKIFSGSSKDNYKLIEISLIRKVKSINRIKPSKSRSYQKIRLNRLRKNTKRKTGNCLRKLYRFNKKSTLKINNSHRLNRSFSKETKFNNNSWKNKPNLKRPINNIPNLKPKLLSLYLSFKDAPMYFVRNNNNWLEFKRS